jgi:hypothetical protein
VAFLRTRQAAGEELFHDLKPFPMRADGAETFSKLKS